MLPSSPYGVELATALSIIRRASAAAYVRGREIPSRTPSRLPPDSLPYSLPPAPSSPPLPPLPSYSLQADIAKTKEAVQKEDEDGTGFGVSPVTVADFTVQAMVLSALRTAFPNDKVQWCGRARGRGCG